MLELNTVIDFVVTDIIMPPVGLALGGVDFKYLVIPLKAAVLNLLSIGAALAREDPRDAVVLPVGRHPEPAALEDIVSLLSPLHFGRGNSSGGQWGS